MNTSYMKIDDSEDEHKPNDEETNKESDYDLVGFSGIGKLEIDFYREFFNLIDLN